MAERFIFPNPFITAVASGEQSGTLPDSLSDLVKLYQAETEFHTDLFLRILDTALIILLGIWVACLLILMYSMYFNFLKLFRFCNNMVTEITDQGLVLHRLPLPVFRRLIPFDELEKVELIENRRQKQGHSEVAEAVTGVLTQRLLRVICPRCRTENPLTDAEQKNMQIPGWLNTVYKGQGCKYCMNTGYYGQTVIAELIQINDELAEMVRQNAPVSVIRQKADQLEMTGIRKDAFEKAAQGITSLEEIRRVLR
ncbi:MAG: hypothetical protein GY749_47785 [Desulfobacteraceae bacterium]|nr:hypothetical protein [Desulfobacteraceae bacterium]